MHLLYPLYTEVNEDVHTHILCILCIQRLMKMHTHIFITQESDGYGGRWCTTDIKPRILQNPSILLVIVRVYPYVHGRIRSNLIDLACCNCPRILILLIIARVYPHVCGRIRSNLIEFDRFGVM